MQTILLQLMCVVVVVNGLAGAQHRNATESAPTQNVTASVNEASHDIVPAAATSGYIIGPSDVLAIATWKEPELSETAPVRSDGKIELPLIGEIQASGLTADQLREVIAEKLKDYIDHPEVNVVVREVRSQTFNLLGKVVRPGAYPLDKPTTVLDAIAGAGGFQEYAKITKIYVLRRDAAGGQRMLPFNYKRVIKGQSSGNNYGLKPGDTIVVP